MYIWMLLNSIDRDQDENDENDMELQHVLKSVSVEGSPDNSRHDSPPEPNDVADKMAALLASLEETLSLKPGRKRGRQNDDS